jgi:alkylation response protein AidB-like acyl-CoA dehydrogenase
VVTRESHGTTATTEAPGKEELLARAERLLAACPPDATDPKDFLRAQYAAGLAWVHFPDGYGGAGASIDLQPTIDDRLAEAQAPPNGRMFNAIGAGQCAATVLLYGTDEQKQHYLPLVFTGDAEWCQLFSEPGSGSDLASLATRAVRDGDEWVVNGQKVWTSGAERARFALLLARSDPDAEKHAGLTAFAVDMHAPGVEVRPLRQMNGGADFNEVFFSDVRIPDRERLGDVGAGWTVAHSTLAQERYNMPRLPSRGSGAIATAVAVWRARPDKTSADARALKDRLLQHWVDAEALRLLQARAATLRALGGSGPEGSLGKLATSVVGRRLAEFLPALLGADAMLIDGYDGVPSMMRRDRRPTGQYAVQRSFVGSPGMSIAGGTDEIQRNIIGDRVLGLPREPSVDRGVPWSQTLRN